MVRKFSHKRALLTFMFVGLLFIYGCERSASDFTISDYEAYGERLTRYLNARDFEKLGDNFDHRSAYHKILALSSAEEDNISEDNQRSVRIELNTVFQKYLKKLATSFDTTRFHYSKTYSVDNSAHVVIALQNKSTYNFLDFALTIYNGKIKITDYYDYSRGENYSDMFIDKELFKLTRVYHGGYAYQVALRDFAVVENYLKREDYKRAWIAFNKIDYTQQWNKSFQQAKLSITRHIADSLYKAAFIDYVNAYYDEDKFRLMKKFEYFNEAGDQQNALLTLDSLTVLVGDNPVVETLRARLSN